MADPVAPFEQQIVVRWQDIDANRHLRNTAYSEFATDTRFRYVAALGYTQERFEALRFGPVILREDIRYRREVLFWELVGGAVLLALLLPLFGHPIQPPPSLDGWIFIAALGLGMVVLGVAGGYREEAEAPPPAPETAPATAA